MIDKLRMQVLDNRLAKLPYAKKQRLMLKIEQTHSLHVVYVMTHVGVSGGSKIIFEHANYMVKLGIDVTIISYFTKPTWFPIEADYIKVPFHIELAQSIPLCDVIVATYWDLIQACIDTGIAPVVYFEQGDSHLFDHDKVESHLKPFIMKMFELPQFVMTVSNRAASFIKDFYGRDAVVFHNALNENIFNINGEKHTTERPYMLMVGSDLSKFKGIPDIVEANRIAKKQGYDLDIIWISATQPINDFDEVTEIFVSPTQEKIGQLYKGAQLYVSGSHYEAFPLPGLEAMACACPVVTTSNSGVKEYAVDGYNSLFAEIGNPIDLANKIVKVLSNEQVRHELIKNGLATAEKYKWSHIVPVILEFYQEVAKYKVQPENQLDEFNIFVTEGNFESVDEYGKFIKFLQYTEADIIKLPLKYSLVEGLVMARWEVVAKRETKTMDQEVNFYCKALGFEDNLLPYQAAYEAYQQKLFERALSLFIKHIDAETDEIQKIVYFRWVLLCLIELEQDDMALKLLDETLKIRKDNADIYYFLTLIFSFKGEAAEMLKDIYKVIELIGEAVSYPEFIVDIEQIVSKLINKEYNK